MRINTMFELLEKYRNNISIRHSTENGNHILVGIVESKEPLEELKRIPVLHEPILNLLRKYSLSSIDTDKLIISPESSVSFKNELSQIKNRISLLAEIVGDMVKRESAFEIYLKLYEINDLEELEKLIISLRKIVFLPITNLEGQVELTGFDVGSKYFNLLLSSAFVFQVFSSLLKESSDLYVHSYQKMIMANKLLESYQLTEDTIKEFKEKTSAEYENSLIERTEKICNSPNVKENLANKNEIEFKNNTKFAIDELVKLMDKGLEIYHSIEAPLELRQNFPNYEKFKELKSSQKLLSNQEANGD
jgi:hypothetical protein